MGTGGSERLPSPDKCAALLVTSHLRAIPGWKDAVALHLAAGRPVLATKAISAEGEALGRGADERRGEVQALEWEGDVRQVMDGPREDLDRLRGPLLVSLGLELSAPGRVALYLPRDDVVALENFADEPARVRLADRTRLLEVRSAPTLPASDPPESP